MSLPSPSLDRRVPRLHEQVGDVVGREEPDRLLAPPAELVPHLVSEVRVPHHDGPGRDDLLRRPRVPVRDPDLPAVPDDGPLGGVELDPAREERPYPAVVVSRDYLDRLEDVEEGVEEPGDDPPVDVLDLPYRVLDVPDDDDPVEPVLLGHRVHPVEHLLRVGRDPEPLGGHLLLEPEVEVGDQQRGTRLPPCG